eukprot:TRINITY_DN34021_c0_g1_i1.p1 TRINITY_DN34021_c0_g1~~TRINITY_DN34021_c0_g1_i1.p1  ORF type:complete len:231 (-),score=41.26 TRINITY_DN34021_c0_g1_i1:75-767(-)
MCIRDSHKDSLWVSGVSAVPKEVLFRVPLPQGVPTEPAQQALVPVAYKEPSTSSWPGLFGADTECQAVVHGHGDDSGVNGQIVVHEFDRQMMMFGAVGTSHDFTAIRKWNIEGSTRRLDDQFKHVFALGPVTMRCSGRSLLVAGSVASGSDGAQVCVQSGQVLRRFKAEHCLLKVTTSSLHAGLLALGVSNLVQMHHTFCVPWSQETHYLFPFGSKQLSLIHISEPTRPY